MRICVLAGGVGGARFLLGARRLLGLDEVAARADSPHRIDAVVNVGDDAWMHGVRICPDLDTCMYTLGGGIDPDRGWGHADETWKCRDELAAYGVQPDWFGLGDKDLATHLVRTQMLDAGYRLTDVTEALCARWNPGVSLLPVTDDRCETHVVVAGTRDEPAPSDAPATDAEVAPATGPRAIHFQEWWVKHKAQLPASGFVHIGADKARPTPEALEAIGSADLVVVAVPVPRAVPLLAAAGATGFDFIRRQAGMFSYSGLSRAQVDRLREEFGIYAVGTGRICVAGLNRENLDYVAEAIAKVA